MPLALALDAIDQAHALGTVEEIYAEGGEPFLLYPVLLEVVRHAHELGMRAGIVTNGYFATTVDDAVHWLKPLQDAGLTSLSVSDDSFHQEASATLTPPQRVAEAAQRLGITVDTICIQPPRTVHEAHAKGTPIAGGEVRFRGRAAEKLLTEDVPRHPWDSFSECPDEDWVELGRLHLDPYGYLYPCQGIAVGNLRRQSLAEIVRTYDPEAHPIVGPILKGGPAELVRAHGLPLHGNFADACHLCYAARQALRERYPGHLAPPEVYGAQPFA